LQLRNRQRGGASHRSALPGRARTAAAVNNWQECVHRLFNQLTPADVGLICALAGRRLLLWWCYKT
jgi:hypothetical protein